MPASGREERMSTIAAVGTYLPPWTRGAARVAGPDEDAFTCGVAAGCAAGRAALSGASTAAVQRVIFVTRDIPLLEGGNGAALLAGLGLEPQLTVIEQVGGGAAALGAVADSAPGTLVVAADCRSEEHTSELQSHLNLVCRLLLEKKTTGIRDREIKFLTTSRITMLASENQT